ncbi:MAG TPA: DUF2391 family protein [Candidatus Woesearchaeota archaeon]|jgi:uncharacterized membrane protein|nr:DUF2391 family protein [Candidatus Woesearchaeota archaeon]
MPEDKSKEKLRKDVQRILDDIQELNKDLNETGEEIEETGEDVEEIKEDIEEIKEDIGTLRKAMSRGKEIFSKMATTVLPDKFAFKDIAQQIVGATILSAPFAVTEEVWNLARELNLTNIIFIVSLTILFDILLFHYTKYQKFEEKKFLEFPKRIISLIVVTYVTSAIVLSVFGVIGGQIQDPSWAMRLIVMVGLFANIGAGTADLIR